MKFLKVSILVLLLPFSLFAWKMESGTVELKNTYDDPEWVKVAFKQAYTDIPLVFSVATDEGSDPSALRIRNVTRNGFEILQVEATPSDGEHAKMTLHYIAAEQGESVLPDGTKIIVGSIGTSKQQAAKNVDTQKGWEDVSFSSDFADTPAVLAMVQSLNNEEGDLPSETSRPWLTVAVDDVTASGFKTALERSEVNEGDVTENETIGYFAIEGNAAGLFYDTSCSTVQYESMVTDDSIKGWDNGCYDFDFANTYAAAPNVVATKQGRKGNNGGWLRECDLSETSVGLTVDEDKFNDSERKHIGEIGGIVVFEKDFVYDSSFNIGTCIDDPLLEYRMDECYWLGSAYESVKDSSSGMYDASAYNGAKVSKEGKLDHAALFSEDTSHIETSDAAAGNTDGNVSIAFWVKLDTQMQKFTVVLTKSKSWDWNDGWGFVNPKNSASDTLRFFIGNFKGTDQYVETELPADEKWVHIAATYDGEEIKLYKNGVLEASVAKSGLSIKSEDPLRVADDDGDGDDATLQGRVDEVKVWSSALPEIEIKALYENESNGMNFNATPRAAVSCSASIAEHTWELVGIPADFRNANNEKTTIADIFSDEMNGAYGTDWRIYRRDYSDSNNSSWYTYLAEDDELEFGKGYWLGSKTESKWSENGAVAVDYNSSLNGTSSCTANRCVEIDLRSVSLDEAEDDLNGTGPYRYNITGFTGKVPVDWADCRIIVDGSVYTPSDAESAGYLSKQIWQYDSGGDNYTTCDDTMECKLIPYKGFWIELHGPTKNKTVKLLIPQE